MVEKKKIEYEDTAKETNGDWSHLVEYCMDLYTDIKDSKYRSKKTSEIEESQSAYNQEEKPTSDPWEGASKIVLPLTTISVDNIEPRIVSGMVGKKPYIRFEMENDQKQDEQTELTETWYNQELEDTVKIERTAGQISHNLLLEGTVYAWSQYDVDEVIRRDFLFESEIKSAQEKNPEEFERLVGIIEQKQAELIGDVFVDPDGNPVTIDKVDSAFEGGRIDLVPFTDIFIPDDSDDWEKTPIIRKVRPTYAELMRDSENKDGFFNIGPWLLKNQSDGNLEDVAPSQGLDDIKVSGKKTIECLECSVTYIYRDENEEEEEANDFTEQRIIALIALDKKIIIRVQLLRDVNWKNEHVIKRIRLFPEKGKAYGTSIYGKIKSIQKGASKTFNLAINIAEVVLIPWFLFEEKVGFKGDKKLKPGIGIPVDSVQGLYFPQFSINPTHMVGFIDLWVQFWERLVSIGDLQVGRKSEKDSTATEVMAVLQEGNIKHNYQSTTFRDEFLSVLRTTFDLYYQYMPYDKEFLYNGEGVQIPRQAMARPYRFKLTGSTDLSNKLIKRRESEDIYTLTRNDKYQVFNPIKSAEDMLKEYGHTDTAEYIDPQMAKIVKAIKEIPGAAEIFEASLKEATAMAQQIEQEGKQKGSEALAGTIQG